MKTLYFTSNNTEQKTKSFLKYIHPKTIDTKFRFLPKQSALMILDMQKFFLDEISHAYIPSAKAIIPNINALIKAYKQISQPVILTRHINTTQNARLMNKWWNDILTSSNPLSEISSDIDSRNTIIIQKSQYDAFYETNLETLLHSEGITQLIITGVMTNLCCETTARNGFIRGFEIFFPADASAAYNEKFHLATLYNLSFGFADIVTTQWLIDRIRSNESQ